MTTRAAAIGRALPCWRAWRYVTEAAAWCGGLLGRLRANRPVHGSLRWPPWSLRPAPHARSALLLSIALGRHWAATLADGCRLCSSESGAWSQYSECAATGSSPPLVLTLGRSQGRRQAVRRASVRRAPRGPTKTCRGKEGRTQWEIVQVPPVAGVTGTAESAGGWAFGTGLGGGKRGTPIERAPTTTVYHPGVPDYTCTAH